jgi:hypothetical protein
MPILDNRADSTLDQPVLVAGGVNPQVASTILDAIAAEEAQEYADHQAKQEAKQQADAESGMAELVEGWQQAMRAARDIIVSGFPQATPVWTLERMDNIGAALAACDEKYGWGGAGRLLGSPLLALAVASFPVAIGTAQLIRVEKQKAIMASLAAKAAQVDPQRNPEGKAGAIDAAVMADTTQSA